MTESGDVAERDCLIVGGGPAGLTAAIYLARFHLAVTVVDSGLSRAAQIPMTRNHAGFPEGISGRDLLERMRCQARLYGADLREGTVTALGRTEGGFFAASVHTSLRSKTVLLATGVANRRPQMLDAESHDRGVEAGLIRYCPICDGYEVTDLRVAVLGTGDRGVAEARFLRSYTADVTLIAPGNEHELSAEQRAALGECHIDVAGRCGAIRVGSDSIELEVDGAPAVFDTLYPALGSDIRSELAEALGAGLSEQGCLIVDAHQRTNVPGLYAAGDVVLGLDQISHAMGEGGVAATTIRNDLAGNAPLLR
ncbi:pyridine nucleotide-disulfide oxidoreductase [Sphingomonas sp. DBB INV C78]|uniref:NAD(P)/FAD-dependent oxidoreductase n=1 Tax=Sphingomonas sp. DBB INV C78 TaxID=3349434 RepID=UPI0036D27EF2